MRDLIRVLRANDLVQNSGLKKSEGINRTIVSIVLCVSAGLMLIMNLKNHSMTMAYSSLVLVIGFAISAVVAGVFKKAYASGVIIAGLVGFVLSVFALTGGNEGFAILWILLVPMFAISLLGILPGLAVSTYFLIFLFVIFTTSYREEMLKIYSKSFVSRFAVLYACDYVIANYFSLQRVYFYRKMQHQAYSDGMTGLYNRRFFVEKLRALHNNADYAIVMVDLNGLKTVNDKFGHRMGDDFISNITTLCKDVFDKNSWVCRIGGDEIAIITTHDNKTVNSLIGKLKDKADKLNAKTSYTLSFAVGVAFSNENSELTFEELYKKSDAEMYKAKMEYYSSNENNRRKR